MLARSTSSSSGQDDYVRPVTYTCRSLDEIRHQNQSECVLDSLTSNHFSSGEESNLKRRQSSEDFLEMQAARNCRQYCRHRYDDFSSSPDPYEDENEAMVDEDEDPLEMARQGTVHLWENEGQNVVICHGISDAYLRTAASPLGSGASDDAVLYRD